MGFREELSEESREQGAVPGGLDSEGDEQEEEVVLAWCWECCPGVTSGVLLLG